MNIRKWPSIATSLFLCASSISAQEKRLKQSDLPAPVAKTAAEVSKGAIVRGYTREKEDGGTVYEVLLTSGGHNKDVQIDAAGNIREVEEDVVIEKLPSPVKSALIAKAGVGKLTAVASLTKHNKLVAYEAQVNTNGKKSEIQVGPRGQTLDHEE